MGLLDNLTELFNTSNLYVVLGVEKTASESDLSKAYKKLSLLCHPDKVSEEKRKEATRKFQVISQVHCILLDKEKRLIYDETGSVDEENSDFEEKDWKNYWRILFPKVTKKDIDDFMEQYKGSEEEIEDLKRVYVECKGDMDLMNERLLGYAWEDEERLKNILNDLIKKEEIPDFPKFTKESKKKANARAKKFKSEAAEAEEMREELGLDSSEEALKTAITKKNENRFDDMIKNLEAKYANKKSTKRRKN